MKRFVGGVAAFFGLCFAYSLFAMVTANTILNGVGALVGLIFSASLAYVTVKEITK
jgi:hypothetical protein